MLICHTQAISPRKRLPSQKVKSHVLAFAMEGTKEAYAPMDGTTKHLEDAYAMEAGRMRLPYRNRADDVSLNNPLLRLERMGCGWVGVLLEWEGVIVEENPELERNAWRALAEEEGKNLPPLFILRRAQGMKSEQAISEVLCWGRDPKHIKRLAQRKEELYEEMQGSTYRIKPGSREFTDTLKRYNIPLAVASTRPRKYLERAIEAVGMEGFFNVTVAAEDVYRGKPDPEMFFYSAERLGFIPERCIVFGSSNSSIEAAHDACMKCVGVAGSQLIFELSAADLAVSRLDNLSVVDLKNLADLESPEFQSHATDLEPELEVQQESVPLSKVAFMDDW
ncbi:hypothetical protein O6H91_15G032000 [Diphasiastrum complanatum]|nr:hypothetical protein O6H91_15G032000 [Diphasiastrum complanatum]